MPAAIYSSPSLLSVAIPQELPWRRIDVSFRGARFGFAHNNIQVTRRWWNFEGEQVPRHLAQQIQLMEQCLNLDSSDRSNTDGVSGKETAAAAATVGDVDDHHDDHFVDALSNDGGEIEAAEPAGMPAV
eukprot:GHUV01047923.1.p2 GENE.GHUV01047923.1~~GHUV01047923.1.p2  ORF type:complete len:129 (-),score=41.41 GHUV01047923.1:384-770(-)